MKRALVVGGLGIVGQGIVKHLADKPDWEVYALSRRTPSAATSAKYISVDVLDRGSCEEKLGDLSGITHIFYAAYQERPTFAEEVAPNLAMLQNVVEIIERVAPGLEHVNLMQGTKAYGTHLGPYKTPAREEDPRHMPPNFYYDQEDFLKSRSRGKSWAWSVLRPRTIYGYALKSPMNMTSILGVYAAISKEFGLPLRFPGTPGCYASIQQAIDTELLAMAAAWVATEPKCANEIFNVTNGGHFRWQHMWPRIAEMLGMECAPLQTIRLAEVMADKAPLWDQMVEKYGLVPSRYEDVVSWRFGDFTWHTDTDSMVETTKIRRFGFHEIVDDEEMFARQLSRLRAERVIP